MPSKITKKRGFHKHVNGYHIPYAILVGIAIVFFWRGVWHLADIFIFPNNEVLSAATCVLIAIIILYLRNFNLKELFAH